MCLPALWFDEEEQHEMTVPLQLLPANRRIQHLKVGDDSVQVSSDVVFTREHDVIRQWAEARQAEPATGEATRSGPHTVHVNDGGAGVRFNFPGAAAFRPISWEEWFENFDQHHCAFVFDNERSKPLNNRYRIVNADQWKNALSRTECRAEANGSRRERSLR